MNVVERSAYAKGANFMQKIVKYGGQNGYSPVSGMCFINCVKYFTDKDYTEEILTFIRNEKYRSGVMTSARLQPFCEKCNINIGCLDGKRINSRTITQRNRALKIQNIHFISL